MKPNGVHLGLWRAERLDCETDVSSSKKWQVCVAFSLPCVPGAGASLPEPPGEDVPSPRSWKHWRCWRCRKKFICEKALHFTFQSECYTKEISTRHVRRMHTLSNVNMSYVHWHACIYKLENTEGTNKAGQHWNTLTVQA